MKYKNREIIEILSFAIVLILYWGFLYLIPHEIIFKNPQIIYIKRNVNIVFVILGFILFLINFSLIADFIIKKIRKQDGLSEKQKSITRKKGKKNRLSLKLFIVVYFILTNLFIVSSQMNMCFSRYELSRYKVVKYNFMNKIVEEYKLNEFSSISLTPTIYSSRTGTTSKILVKLNGPINITFKEGQKFKLRLIFFIDLKNNFPNIRIEKQDLLRFKKHVFHENTLTENEKLFNEIFIY